MINLEWEYIEWQQSFSNFYILDLSILYFLNYNKQTQISSGDNIGPTLRTQ